jgi:cytochrome P450
MSLEYDPFSEEVMKDPYPIYKRLRSEAPCYFLGKWDAWALSRFEDIWEASMDADNYSTAQGTTAAHLLTRVQPVTPMLNLMDPPQHTQLRSKIRRFFTPGRVTQLQPRIQEIVDEAFALLDDVHECDVYNDVATKISVRVACLANGFPMEDADMLNTMVWRFFARQEAVEGMTEDGLAAMMEMAAYFADLVKTRRKNPDPDRSAVDTVLDIEIDGRRFTDEEAGSHLSMFLIGGAETFPKVFSSAVYLLWKHPDQRRSCVEDRGLLPDAFNEVLRYDMPTQFLCRTTLRDVTLHGVTMREGRPVMLLYPSGNRDPREFPNPDVFDIHRRAPRVVSFGYGIHRCMGVHFARLEGRVLLEETLRAIPEYEVEHPGVRQERTEFVRGFRTLPIRF